MYDHKELHIYGQSNDFGRLRVENAIQCTKDSKLYIHGGDIYADATNSDTSAGIGGYKNNFQSRFELYVYGGKVDAHGRGAGIGGGHDNNGGTVTIYDGSVKAYGWYRSPGIGGGFAWDKDEKFFTEFGSGGTLIVWGGYVYAEGGKYAAGIGAAYNHYNGTMQTPNGGTVVVNGGVVEAKGGTYGAGIGGGQDGCGAHVTVNGGIVRAYGGTDAAGIGSGERCSAPSGRINGGSLTVNGGEVFADGTDWGAGIGGGEDAKGANVTINGGLVMAWAGADAGKKNGSAIGSEDGDGCRGTLHIGDKMMVHAGQNPDDANGHLFSYGERVTACFFRPYTRVEPCDH